MSDATASLRWLSAHIFFAGDVYGPAADGLLRDLIVPVVARMRDEGLANGYFFIRYAEGGPHIRLRLQVVPDRAADVAASLMADVRRLAPAADLQPFDSPFPDIEAAPCATRWTSDTSAATTTMTRLRWIAYERELERYGGPAAIGIAESVFQASSDAVLGLLRNPEAPTRAARLGIAILTMLATLRECFEGREAIARFVRDYGVAYLRGATGGDPQRSSALGRAFAQGFSRQATELREQVQATWQSLETGCVLGGEGASALSAYLQALAGARRLLQARCAAGEIAVHGVVTRSWEACAPRLVPSYVHMMNNRLGISVLEEAYLAHLVLWALTDNANEVQHAGGREAHAVGSPSTNGHAC